MKGDKSMWEAIKSDAGVRRHAIMFSVLFALMIGIISGACVIIPNVVNEGASPEYIAMKIVFAFLMALVLLVNLLQIASEIAVKVHLHQSSKNANGES